MWRMMIISYEDNWDGQRTGIDMEKDTKEKKKNVHIEQLLTTLDSEQWKSLSHVRSAPYPVALEDKRRLLNEMMVI